VCVKTLNKIISLRVSEELREKLKKYCNEKGYRKISRCIRDILREKISDTQ
jgi:Ribbon-helix-helix protein, copG family.